MIKGRQTSTPTPLTEAELVNQVFDQLKDEINSRAYVNRMGGYHTELMALEQVRLRTLLLGEVWVTMTQRSMFRTILNEEVTFGIPESKKD
jgi:hypothetical protein